MISSTLILVLFGLGIISSVAGVIGSYTFLRKRTLIGDAVSHSVLPGVAVGFLLTGTKDPISLLFGGLVFGYLALVSIDWINRHTKLSEDAAIAIVSTTYFGLGSVLLSIISSMENGQQSGLKNFLFGKAATLTELDILVFIASACVVFVFILLFFKPFLLISFNRDFAETQGWNVKKYETILSLLSVLVITIGLQAVGVVLMSALLIAPSAAARYWTNSLKKMMVLAAIFGGLAGIGGGLLSLLGENMPTGPWVVMLLFLFTMITLLFAPKNGYWSRRKQNKLNKSKINRENTLKLLYQIHEAGSVEISFSEILKKRNLEIQMVSKTLEILKKENFVKFNSTGKWILTEIGIKEAKRIVRLHRLWELYLTKRLNFKEDHIHGTAETIEHLINDEMEEILLKELDYPDKDPHDKFIPY